jgi:hypothetical protein
MVIGFKTVMGAGAIASVAIIAATERGPAPVKPVLIADESFDDRFPYVIVAPKQDREHMAALPSKQETAHAETKTVVRVESGHKPKLRTTCHRRHYYIKGHRYWSCKR